MKKTFFLILGLLILFSDANAQKRIKGISTYFQEGDTISLSSSELNYLISRSDIVCAKIDTLDDGSMIKTIEIECRDKTFHFVSAYMESDLFFSSDLLLNIEQKAKKLKCAFVLVDNGELYESYELDSIGRGYFEKIINNTPLVCHDNYE